MQSYWLALQFVPTEKNKPNRIFTVVCHRHLTELPLFCLSCWGVDCASPDKSKLEWKLHFLECKSRLLGVKKLKYPNVHFSILSPLFLLSFDLSLSCKLQLIDLITVFAAFLVGWQTILVSFFSQEYRNRKETNGWKSKSATGRYRYTSHVLSIKSFAQYLRMQLKNDFFTFI